MQIICTASFASTCGMVRGPGSKPGFPKKGIVCLEDLICLVPRLKMKRTAGQALVVISDSESGESDIECSDRNGKPRLFHVTVKVNQPEEADVAPCPCRFGPFGPYGQLQPHTPLSSEEAPRTPDAGATQGNSDSASPTATTSHSPLSKAAVQKSLTPTTTSASSTHGTGMHRAETIFDRPPYQSPPPEPLLFGWKLREAKKKYYANLREARWSIWAQGNVMPEQ